MMSMKVGDKAFFYHSNAKTLTGIVGSVEIARTSYPDYTAFEKGKYYDPKSTAENPRWFMVDVKLSSIWKHPLLLEEIKQLSATESTLKDLMVVRRGCRLSIQPLKDCEWGFLNDFNVAKSD